MIGIRKQVILKQQDGMHASFQQFNTQQIKTNNKCLIKHFYQLTAIIVNSSFLIFRIHVSMQHNEYEFIQHFCFKIKCNE